MKFGFNWWIIPTVIPEFGVTFSYSRHSVSACVYIVKINVIVSVHWEKAR